VIKRMQQSPHIQLRDMKVRLETRCRLPVHALHSGQVNAARAS
jgi:hypothetical protein